MAGSIPKFFDAEIRPPVGGWHYFTNPSNHNTLFRKQSADAVIDEIQRYERNNGKQRPREEIEREVWQYWCSLQPERCGGAPQQAGGIVPMLPKDIGKEFFGPIIWRFLNLAAVRFEFTGRDYFLSTVQHVHNLMTCPTCRQHWLHLLEKYPPTRITTTKEACVWVNTVHNEVNAIAGKGEYPYSRMVTEYGAPL
jgi:hypothetical protein